MKSPIVFVLSLIAFMTSASAHAAQNFDASSSHKACEGWAASRAKVLPNEVSQNTVAPRTGGSQTTLKTKTAN